MYLFIFFIVNSLIDPHANVLANVVCTCISPGWLFEAPLYKNKINQIIIKHYNGIETRINGMRGPREYYLRGSTHNSGPLSHLVVPS